MCTLLFLSLVQCLLSVVLAEQLFLYLLLSRVQTTSVSLSVRALIEHGGGVPRAFCRTMGMRSTVDL